MIIKYLIYFVLVQSLVTRDRYLSEVEFPFTGDGACICFVAIYEDKKKSRERFKVLKSSIDTITSNDTKEF